MYHFTALATCLALLVYMFSCIQVSRARIEFGVKLPAISGNTDFERVFRAQMNTLEWLPFFLPSLWLFAIYVSDSGAAALGAVWILGRILYVLGYARPSKNAARDLLSRRWQPSPSGWERSAPSSGGWFMGEGLKLTQSSRRRSL
jgi:glutathione S-transferase